MTAVRIAINLPYHLNLPRGEYAIGSQGAVFLARAISAGSDPVAVQTRVLSVFDIPDEIDRESEYSIAVREAGRLIRRVNRLLRWYRQLASLPGILEITRAQVSPFEFDVVESRLLPGKSVQKWTLPALDFEAEKPIPAQFATAEDLAASLRENLATAIEPNVAKLNLLDARHAKSVGRFREAVLLSWSVIDSSFIGKFETLVDKRLSGEWREARKFLKGHDFGLRHKMTTGLRLVASRSFYDEPNGFWDKLSKSYERRNAIIHEGAGADEDDAEQAIAVAHNVLDIIDTL
jgi:hypothetical protein